MPCPELAKPVKAVWHMHSERATLRMLQNCFNLNAQSVWHSRKVRFRPYIDDIGRHWATIFKCQEHPFSQI